HAWSRATTAFALFQALAGYAYSYLYAASGGNYTLLFVLGGAAVTLALLLDFIRPAARARDPLSP
ncbi:MAG: MFS transporter, partial [Pseudomonas sp.]